jgi:hypothetical protein
MMLKMLDFGGVWFVAKLTKRMGAYYKQGYWSKICAVLINVEVCTPCKVENLVR